VEGRPALGLRPPYHAVVDRKLRSHLRRRGASKEVIAEAEREGWLTLLAFERTITPGPRRYTFPQIAAKAGVPVATAQRIWRAFGFPDPPMEDVAFTDHDVEALASALQLGRSTLAPSDSGDGIEELVQQIRVMGAALARIAEVQGDNLVRAVHAGQEAGLSDAEIARAVSNIDLAEGERLLAYGMRLQLRATAWRRLALETATDPEGVSYAVGFVDLVGYTALSQQLDEQELAALVTRFEALAYDTVAQYGGRVVKTIGDEVMFVTPDVATAARITLRLTERSSTDDVLPDARAGLSCGEVVAREGDYYGAVVNLARRLVELARPGTAVCSESVHEALADDPGFTWRRLRTRRIRDIGPVALWQLQSVADTSELPTVTG